MHTATMTITVTGALMLLAGSVFEPVFASGQSHRDHRYGQDSHYRHGHSGLRIGIGYGRRHGHSYGHSRRHRGHRRHRYGGGVSFSFYAPLHVPQRPQTVLIHEQRVSLSRPSVLPDMPTLTYIAGGEQESSTLTRDRRQCESLAWRQTRPEPRGKVIQTVHREPTLVARGGHTQSVLYPAANGAVLGAIGGAIAGNTGAGAAIGALVGAGSWLLSGAAAAQDERIEREVHVREYVPAAGPDPRALRHALSECMQARNYTVQ